VTIFLRNILGAAVVDGVIFVGGFIVKAILDGLGELCSQNTIDEAFELVCQNPRISGILFSGLLNVAVLSLIDYVRDDKIDWAGNLTASAINTISLTVLGPIMASLSFFPAVVLCCITSSIISTKIEQAKKLKSNFMTQVIEAFTTLPEYLLPEKVLDYFTPRILPDPTIQYNNVPDDADIPRELICPIGFR